MGSPSLAGAGRAPGVELRADRRHRSGRRGHAGRGGGPKGSVLAVRSLRLHLGSGGCGARGREQRDDAPAP